MSSRRLRRAIEALATLGEPQRLRLYELVRASTEPVSRDQAAEALGIKRGIASFHLDKLVEEGLLEVDYRRLNDRAGPGAGRPAKLYRRSSAEIDASTPERDYETAAELLATGIAQSVAKNISIEKGVRDAAKTYGKELASQIKNESTPLTVDRVCDFIAEHGYEPAQRDDDIVLRNCPFHHLAQRHTDLVCTMNLEIFKALDKSLDEVDMQPRLEPEPGHCCVKLSTT